MNSFDRLEELELVVAIYERLTRVVGPRSRIATHYHGSIKKQGDDVEFRIGGLYAKPQLLRCDKEIQLPKKTRKTTPLDYEAFHRRALRVARRVVAQIGITSRTRMFAGNVVGDKFIYGIKR